MEQTIQKFKDIQVGLRKNEVWRHVDFSAFLTGELSLPHPNERQSADYHCNIPGLDAVRATVENGFCHAGEAVMEEGVVISGLRDACANRADFVRKYFGQALFESSPYAQYNTNGYTDGVFVYVPDGVKVRKPIQLQSVINAGHGLFLQVRNLVVVGRGSQVTIVHCDDSYDKAPAFANNVTELHVGESSQVEYYMMENLNDQTGLLNHTYVRMGQEASFRSVAVMLNGGHIRNHTEVRMDGEHCDVNVHGLYINDKNQRVDNYVYVDHAHPNCKSQELFKGILDDTAHATFNGHVMVREGATKTEAYQSNKNILLTDKAYIDTKPFLEIYNDDVKCSHGSTIGQLDEQQLFYIRSRGISERTAKTLLMFAFCSDVLQHISLDPLRESLSDLVKKRLHGEQTLCADCALHCSTPCNGPEVNFHIDVDKL